MEEGQTLQPNQFIGYVDSVQLYLRKQQLEAQIASTTSQIPDIPVQIAALAIAVDRGQKEPGRV